MLFMKHQLHGVYQRYVASSYIYKLLQDIELCSNHKDIGNIGELCVIDSMQSRGYVIRETNWRYKNRGEIDIICDDLTEIVFIEVKTSVIRETDYENDIYPEDRCGNYKIRKIKRLSELFLVKHPKYTSKELIFLLVTVRIDVKQREFLIAEYVI